MKSLWSVLRTNILAGLLVILPAGATIWLVSALWNLLDKPLRYCLELFNRDPKTFGDSWSEWIVAALLERGINLGPLSHIPGLGLIITITVIFLLGLGARSLLGRTFIAIGEALVHRVPVIGSVYAALKQLLETVFSDSSKVFRQAVFIEFPCKGIWTIAFVANEVPPSIAVSVPTPQGQTADMLFCFVPTTPNPTSGWLVAMPREAVFPLSIRVEDALKLVISGGIVLGNAHMKGAPGASGMTSVISADRTA